MQGCSHIWQQRERSTSLKNWEELAVALGSGSSGLISAFEAGPCSCTSLFPPFQVLKVESTWHIRTECPELLVELVEWIRGPWEEMFSIELRRAVYEGLE